MMNEELYMTAPAAQLNKGCDANQWVPINQTHQCRDVPILEPVVSGKPDLLVSNAVCLEDTREHVSPLIETSWNVGRQNAGKLRRRSSWPCLTSLNGVPDQLNTDALNLGSLSKRVILNKNSVNSIDHGTPWNALVFKMSGSRKTKPAKEEKDPNVCTFIDKSEVYIKSETRRQYAQFRPLKSIRPFESITPITVGDDTLVDIIPSAIVRKGHHRKDVVAINYGLIRIRNCNTSQEYDCIDRDNGRKFVVKLIPKPSSCVEVYELLCEINHSSFVKVTQVLEDSTLFYILLDSCNTIPLYDHYISTHSRMLDNALLKKTILSILRGIAFLHSRGYVLGSFSIDSVVIAIDNGEVNTLISNIDCIQHTNKRKQIHIEPSNDQSIYKAPETRQGVLTYSSDLWSCGVLLYYLVEGALPYECVDMENKYTSTGLLKFKSDLWSECPDMANFCVNLLQFDCKKRIGSAVEAMIHPWFTNIVHTKKF